MHAICEHVLGGMNETIQRDSRCLDRDSRIALDCYCAAGCVDRDIATVRLDGNVAIAFDGDLRPIRGLDVNVLGDSSFPAALEIPSEEWVSVLVGIEFDVGLAIVPNGVIQQRVGYWRRILCRVEETHRSVIARRVRQLGQEHVLTYAWHGEATFSASAHLQDRNRHRHERLSFVIESVCQQTPNVRAFLAALDLGYLAE